MAVVWLARQIDLDRTVAIKELRAVSASGDTSLVDRFLREARVAGRLTHPNVVTVFDYFDHNGTPCMAMEYIEHGSLRERMKQLSLAQTFGVIENVLAALDHAERQHIVHRDLKPENLLITGDGRVKVADFGIAKALGGLQNSALTATGMTIGTPAYMAPEQAMARQLGPFTDLYSLGVIAWELLVGRLPFAETEVPMAIIMRTLNDDIPLAHTVNPAVDPALSAWIAALLIKDTARRTQTAAQAWDELEDIVERLLGARWRRSARLLGTAGAPPDQETTLTPSEFAETSFGTPTPVPAAPPPGRVDSAPPAPRQPTPPEQDIDEAFETFVQQGVSPAHEPPSQRAGAGEGLERPADASAREEFGRSADASAREEFGPGRPADVGASEALQRPPRAEPAGGDARAPVEPPPGRSVQPPPDRSVAPPPDRSVTPPPDRSVTPPPDRSVTPPPDRSVTPPPDRSVTPPPDRSVTPPPDRSVTPPPDRSVTPPPERRADPPPLEHEAQPPPVERAAAERPATEGSAAERAAADGPAAGGAATERPPAERAPTKRPPTERAPAEGAPAEPESGFRTFELQPERWPVRQRQPESPPEPVERPAPARSPEPVVAASAPPVEPQPVVTSDKRSARTPPPPAPPSNAPSRPSDTAAPPSNAPAPPKPERSAPGRRRLLAVAAALVVVVGVAAVVVLGGGSDPKSPPATPSSGPSKDYAAKLSQIIGEVSAATEANAVALNDPKTTSDAAGAMSQAMDKAAGALAGLDTRPQDTRPNQQLEQAYRETARAWSHLASAAQEGLTSQAYAAASEEQQRGQDSIAAALDALADAGYAIK